MSDVESEEMQLFRESVRRMVAREVAPIAARIDEEDEFPREILDIFGDMGLLQILVPESYGGPGGTITMSCVANHCEFALADRASLLTSLSVAIASVFAASLPAQGS